MSINNSINNSSLTNNNNNTSISSETKIKKLRKDAQGNIILKKEKRKLKSKFHVHLIDNVYPGKQLAHVIDVESYKKYNLENGEIEENEDNLPNENEDIKEDKSEIKQRCCSIF